MWPDQKEITYSLTYKEVLEILKIIDESPCQELRLELEGFKLEIIKGRELSHHAHEASSTPSAPIPSPVASLGSMAMRNEPAPQAERKGDVPQGEGILPGLTEIVPGSGVEVKSPLSGTFYRAPAPGARPFVEEGDEVEAGEQVGIVEVMKLMNSVKSPVKGKVRKILVANETMVKMGQTLMIIEPF